MPDRSFPHPALRGFCPGALALAFAASLALGAVASCSHGVAVGRGAPLAAGTVH